MTTVQNWFQVIEIKKIKKLWLPNSIDQELFQDAIDKNRIYYR